jgi:glycosyltransferase involved in cell wall biosynthesis
MNPTEKINILFYLPALDQRKGGMRQYAACLLHLFREFPERYSFFIGHEINDPVVMAIIESTPRFKIVSRKSHKVYVFEKLAYYSTVVLKKVLNNFFKLKLSYGIPPDAVNKLIKRHKIDIFHCPYQYIPVADHVKLICTMHDVQELYFPEFFTAAVRASRAADYYDYIRRADAVVVSYDHVKQDIIKFFDKDPNDVCVALMKMDNLWFSKFTGAEDHNNRAAVEDAPGKYLFYPANTWKHKNHEALIEAVCLLKTQKNMSVSVIFVGDNNNEWGRYLKALVIKHKLESQIVFLGIVDELTLYRTYANAWGVVVPTLYEAGSFPLIESIFMKLPVICSNVTSLPETIGNEEFMFNPTNIEEIAEKVDQLWSNNEFRSASIHNTLSQQGRLINTGASIVIENLYKRLLGETNQVGS